MSLQVALSRIPVEATFIVVDGNGEMVKDAYVVLKLSQYYTTSAEPSKPAYVLAGRYSVQVVCKGSIILYPAPVDVRESGVYRIVINPSML
ncbi:MAG: hypothetical protein LRS49_04985 [Desulfurococcales archaeon]|nr:hypothetical protein [Desulfurococcales archaeon]